MLTVWSHICPWILPFPKNWQEAEGSEEGSEGWSEDWKRGSEESEGLGVRGSGSEVTGRGHGAATIHVRGHYRGGQRCARRTRQQRRSETRRRTHRPSTGTHQPALKLQASHSPYLRWTWSDSLAARAHAARWADGLRSCTNSSMQSIRPERWAFTIIMFAVNSHRKSTLHSGSETKHRSVLQTSISTKQRELHWLVIQAPWNQDCSSTVHTEIIRSCCSHASYIEILILHCYTLQLSRLFVISSATATEECVRSLLIQ